METFNGSVSGWLTRCCSQFANAGEFTYASHDGAVHFISLVGKQLKWQSVPVKDLLDKYLSDGHGLLVWQGPSLCSFSKVINCCQNIAMVGLS